MTRKANLVATPLLTLLLLTIGCAVPGEPMPPLLEIPAPVSGLTAHQEGRAIMIRFPVPQLTTEGTRPRRMGRIELLVVYTSPSEPQPNIAAQGTLMHTWTAPEIPQGTMEIGHRIELGREHITKRAWLAVRTKNNRAVDAGLSNVIAIDVVSLPGVPADLSATVTERAVELTWSPSLYSEFGVPSAGNVEYEIFRSGRSLQGPPESIGKSHSTSYSDREIIFGQGYQYSVRAVVPSDVSIAVTALSTPIEAIALDRFAPAAPTNLRAIAVTGAVELAWTPNAETDLAGYNVYREQLDAGSTTPRRKLNAELLDISLSRDESAELHRVYRYTVTAVDAAGNEGPASNEEIVETE